MRIIIDGKDAIVKKGTSIDYILSNPFFTKDGSYTLDIEIDLSIPSNAMLYKHIQRLDTTERPTQREAVIIDNGIVISRGTEIILSVEDDIAKIQIVTDNSELNYLSSKRSSIRDITMNKNNTSFVYPLFAMLHEGLDEQKWGIFNFSVITGQLTKFSFPRLLSVIERVIEDAGYTIEENVLATVEEYQDLYILPENANIALLNKDYNKWLPDWNAGNFFTEIEKFFNVLFLKKENSKKVSIVSADDYFKDESNVVDIENEDVMDMFSKTYDVENNLYTNYNNVRYELPKKNKFLYSDIDEKVLQKSITADFYENLPSRDSAGSYIMYTSSVYGYSVVWKKISDGENEKNDKYILRQCKQFQSVKGEGENDDVVLKIVPADIIAMNVGWGNFVTLPNISSLDYEESVNGSAETQDTEDNFTDDIESGIEEDKGPNTIQIAFIYNERPYESNPGGTCNFYSLPINPILNQSKVSRFVAYSSVRDQSNTQVFATPNLNKDLGINYRYNRFYTRNRKADTSVEYVMKFKNKGRIFDAKSIFKIKNKLYYCKDLKYVINDNGIGDLTEGTFYRLYTD